MTTHDHAHDRDEHCHEHPGKHCHSHVDVHGDEACVAIGGTEVGRARLRALRR